MRIGRSVIANLAAAMAAVGCPAAAEDVTPLTDPAYLAPVVPTDRFDLQGFSLQPPAGERWFALVTSHPNHPAKLLPHVAQTVAVIRKPESSVPARPEDAESIYMIAVTTTRFGTLTLTPMQYLSGMRQSYEEQYKADARSDRFRPVEFNASLEKTAGAECMKYRKTLEDHRVRRFPGTVFIMSDLGILCVHPDSPRFTINIWISQRHLRGEQPVPVQPELAHVLDSLKFLPIRRFDVTADDATTSSQAARRELARLYIPVVPGALLTHAQAGNANAVELLVVAGLNPDAEEVGVPPLLIAAIAGHSDVLRVLLVKGASVNARDPRLGATALMGAVAAGHVEAVRALLAAGADVNMRASDGTTALAFAKRTGNASLVELLKQAGARE